jgi:hypothetical protein
MFGSAIGSTAATVEVVKQNTCKKSENINIGRHTRKRRNRNDMTNSSCHTSDSLPKPTPAKK